MNDHSAIWAAVQEQATIWSEVASVTEMTAGFSRQGEGHDDSVPTTIAGIKSGYGGMLGNPMTIGSMAERLLQADSRFTPPGSLNNPAVKQWIETAKRVEAGHRLTIAWIRSRLPHFPIIRVPQLVRNSHFTTYEFTPRFYWPIEERQMGLQFQSLPRQVGEIIGADADLTSRINQSAEKVFRALQASEEWRDFAAAAGSLDEEAKKSLTAARSALQPLLASEAIDAQEPQGVMDRHNYRAHVMADAVATLSGVALDYTQSFGLICDLIDLSASEVFGQLLTQPLVPVAAISDLDLGSGRPGRIEFDLNGGLAIIMECGDIVWLDDPVVVDAVRLDSISTSFDATGEMNARVGATILAGSASVWTRPTQ